MYRALYDPRRRDFVRHAIEAGDIAALQKRKMQPEAAMQPEGVGLGYTVTERHTRSLEFLEAVRRGDVADASDALAKGAFVDFRDSAGVTKLFEFNQDPVDYARQELGRSQGKTPLMIAAEKGDHAMMLLLIRAGADVNADTSYGSYPFPNVLRHAADEETAELLRQHGARD